MIPVYRLADFRIMVINGNPFIITTEFIGKSCAQTAGTIIASLVVSKSDVSINQSRCEKIRLYGNAKHITGF